MLQVQVTDTMLLMKMPQHQKMLEAGVLSNDSDADTGSSMTVTGITGASAGSVGGSTDGTYGTLTLNSDGSYSYTADKAAADALAHNATANDVFTYTVTDNEGNN